MEYRLLGGSGFKVPVLGLGTATFGGGNDFFRAWGSTQVAEAKRLVDIALEAGANLFDTADVYSNGLAEEILGKAITGRRDKVLISTKATFPMGDGPNAPGLLAPASPRRLRGEPAPARHRRDRPLAAARLRCHDSDRGNLARAGRPG